MSPEFPFNKPAPHWAYAKANPGRINYASSGIGTGPHVSAELFKMMSGVNMMHVPYRGAAPALTDQIAGQTQVMFDNVSSSIGYIRAGKLRPLAVTTATRSDALPDIPTVGDFLPGYEASVVNGIGVPKGTPPEIVAILNREINAGLADAKVKAQLANLGFSFDRARATRPIQSVAEAALTAACSYSPSHCYPGWPPNRRARTDFASTFIYVPATFDFPCVGPVD